MSRKILSLLGALLLVGGILTFLLGAFVLTNNARHQDVSPAVYAGAAMAAGGILVFIVLGIGLIFGRRGSN